MSHNNANDQIGDTTGPAELEPEPFRQALLRWFDGHQRDLPWRHVDDPYAVWVSEIMLQQTRVATVIDYFERWMDRFPTIEDLAQAPIEEILEMWSGLGYYRRARFLHRAAGQVVEQRGGVIPQTVSELQELPGIGPYTAGAIASIAFGRPAPLVDGNVMRVLSRLYAIEGQARRAPAKAKIWARAAELVDPERPGDFNQGLMELGSEVCTARSPKCLICPVRTWCRGFATGDPEQFPEPKKKVEQRPMRALSCVIHRNGGDGRQFLLHRRKAKGLLGGLWEFPSREQEGEEWPQISELTQWLRANDDAFAVEDPGPALGRVTHVFSHRKLQTKVYDVVWEQDPSLQAISEDRWRWVDADELSTVASSALLGKIKTLWAAESAHK